VSSNPWLSLSDLPDAPFAWGAGRVVSRAEFAWDVARYAQQLPTARYIVNRCTGRYQFALVFAAACLSGKINLLAPASAEGALAQLREAYADAVTIDDSFFAGPPPAPASVPLEMCAADHAAAIAFTSGSTGEPQPHVKTWRALAMSALYCRQRMGGGIPLNAIATVPHHHMFGLETITVTAIAAGWALHDGPAFLPHDVLSALEKVPRPRVLITTPFHLRHVLNARPRMPPVEVVLSATAPLSRELAAEAEERFGAEVMEIYGFTEAGSVATRRTAATEAWEPYPGVRFALDANTFYVDADHLADRKRVNDRLELQNDGRFLLLGRDIDLIKVAGRRASLSDITRRVLAVPGVRDAVVFAPDEAASERVAALVVAPGLDEAVIRRELEPMLDAVFIPRPLRVVADLPRNALGKLPRQALLALLAASDD
jgi:acyl-coenzyme A synthetase/AMP-(fatty) acid ligase